MRSVIGVPISSRVRSVSNIVKIHPYRFCDISTDMNLPGEALQIWISPSFLLCTLFLSDL